MIKENLPSIYQAENGEIKVNIDSDQNTLWASLDEIAFIFNRDKSVISRHIKDIFKTSELEENSVVAKNATTASDRKTYMVKYYNLDLILSVGYRVNSKQATKFRKWANNILRNYIIEGYNINPNRIQKNYNNFMKAVTNIKTLLSEKISPDENTDFIKHRSVIELISQFAKTWFSLDAFDKDNLLYKGIVKEENIPTIQELESAIKELRNAIIIEQGKSAHLFAIERENEILKSIFNNVIQSFDGIDIYPAIEEKAAHLFYFVVKDHPFVDGNKRCGAYVFIWFLKKCNILDESKITPEALTALTLFIAESDPKDKDKIISLIIELLK